MGLLEYGVVLADKMSGPAREASSSVSGLATQLTNAKTSVASLSNELARGRADLALYERSLARAKESGNIEQYRAASRLVDETKNSVFGLAQQVARGKDAVFGLGQQLRSAEAAAVPAESALSTLGISVAGLATGAVAAAGALVGVVYSVADLTVRLSAFAVEATEGKAALVDTFAALGGGLKVGRDTEAMLSDLSTEIGITKDTLEPFTKSFMAMGFEGTEALKKVTTAAISAQAIMRDPAAAQSFENLEKKIQVAVQTGQGLKIPAKGLASLASVGLRVEDVASRMGVRTHTLAAELKAGTVNAAAFGDAMQDALIQKGAGPVARMSISVSNLRAMFGQSVQDMFEDLEGAIDPALVQAKDFFGIFSQAEPSGQAMKSAIGGAFTYIFGEARAAILPIKHFFLDLEIYALESYIAMKPLVARFDELERHSGGLLSLSNGMRGMATATAAFADAAVRGAVALESMLKTYDKINGATGGGVGKSIADGIVNGLTGGVGGVVKSGVDLGKAATQGVNQGADVHSPSRATFRSGAEIGGGLVLGLERAARPVQAASTSLGRGAVEAIRPDSYARGLASSSPYAGAGAAGGRSMTINVEPGAIVIQAPNGVTDAKDLTEVAVATLFERWMLHEGA